MGDMAVMRKVVAAHDGEGRNACLAAVGQRPRDGAEGGARPVRAGGVMADVVVVGAEGAGIGVGEIAALGHRQRDDADRRIAHRGDQRAVALLDRDEIDHRADESRLEVAGRKLDHARHPVLRRQRLAHLRVARPHPGADDGPVLRQAEPEEVVEIDRHMGAVEIAAADMDDAGLQSRAVIARRGHAIGQVFQRCIGRFHVMPS